MHNLDRPRLRLAAAITAMAGYVDAVGYLSADRYFVSFMSGNTTRTATDLVIHGARAAIPALLIVGFVMGVAAGSVIAHRAGRARKPAVLGAVTLLLTAAMGCGMFGWRAALMACLVLAMGALNSALRSGENPIALTYLTGALVRLGQALAGLATGERGEGTGVYVLVWLALATGAASGAAMFLRFGVLSLAGGVVGSLILTGCAWRISRATPSP